MREFQQFEVNFSRRIDLKPDHFSYAHFRIGDGSATVGGIRQGNNLYYSIALCSPLDNFSRKIGRRQMFFNLISRKSNLRGVYNIRGIEDEPPPVLLKRALVAHLRKMHHKPAWLRKDNTVELRGKRRA